MTRRGSRLNLVRLGRVINMELFWISVIPIATIFFLIGFLSGIKKSSGEPSPRGPLVYDFENSNAGQIVWNWYKKMSVEDRCKRFPASLRKGSGLVLPPGLKVYLLKDAALVNSPSGEFIQGTVESTHDEAVGD